MKLVVFGLTVTSSWGNGHATLWRGLCRALHSRGHQVIFFERDQPFYAGARDFIAQPGLEVVLYDDWCDVRDRAARELHRAEAAMVTSFCPDADSASGLVLEAAVEKRCFYDLDTPVTLSRLADGEHVAYLPRGGLSSFDLVLSYTGGKALGLLCGRLGAQRSLPLYGSVDPDVHRPAPPRADFEAALSYLGTYSADRQARLAELLLAPADQLRQRWFSIAGAQYPDDFPWRRNLRFVRHLAPADHPAFFSSSLATLNVTRAPMAALGFCPSPRFFEAAACGVPVISDVWEGMEHFLKPGREVLLAHSRLDVVNMLELSRAELAEVGRRARERVLSEHTALHRAVELEQALFGATRPIPTSSNAGSSAC
jgi:spore maturation protein CgeB